MTRPNIKIDETPAVCTVSCTACPSYVELAGDRLRAENKGVDHLGRVHPQQAGSTPFDRARQYRAAQG